MENLLNKLLGQQPPDMRRDVEHKTWEIPRLSKLVGEPFLVELRGLSYDEIVEVNATPAKEADLHLLLYGVVTPSLRDAALMAQYGAVTPVEAVKALLTPGEIRDLCACVERLSGFRMRVIREVKNA